MTPQEQLTRLLAGDGSPTCPPMWWQRYDVGLKPLPPMGAADLSDFIAGRDERSSIILTSYRASAEWPELFGDPLLANTGLDRLADRAIVMLITGANYRLKRKEEIPTVTS